MIIIDMVTRRHGFMTQTTFYVNCTILNFQILLCNSFCKILSVLT